ncbi:MAG: DUF1049 domain-containing protein [bacterium]
MHVKTIIIAILIVLCIIFILQNTGAVNINFLFWEIVISRIILIPLLLIVGYILGYISAKVGFKRK